jgi:hypothetical protein
MCAQNNNALYFDGVDDYLPTSNPITGSGEFTLEARVKTSGVGNPSNIIITLGDGAGSNQCAWLYIDNAGKLRAAMSGSSTAVSAASINDNRWHHVAVVFSLTNNKFTLYIDGIQDGITPMTVSPAITGTSTVIGSCSAANQSFWEGCIDAVRIWNIARHVDSIASNCNKEIYGSRTNLLKNFNFNQGTAFGNNAGLTSCTNESGIPASSTIHNFALSGNTSNWVSAGIHISGDSNTINDNSGILDVKATNNTNFSISEHGESITKTFLIKNYGGTILTIPAGGITFGSYDPEDFSYSGINLPVTILADSSLGFNITYTPDLTTPSASYAEVHIASNDNLTNDYNYYISGGIRATALKFDGTNDYVSTTNSLSGSSANFSIEAWIKAPPTTERRSIVSMGGSPANQGIYLFINQDGKLEADLSYNAGPISNSVVADDKWHHVALVCTANSFQLYVDGIADGSSMTMAPALTTTYGLLGATYNSSYTSTLYFFQGCMDEVRIWSVARTPADIFNNMFKRVTAVTTGLVANYQFNEGIAGGSNQTITNLPDFSGSNFFGTLTNFTLLGTSSNWITGSGIFVAGNGHPILSESTEFSIADNTNFGYSTSGTPITKTFSIINKGNKTMNLLPGCITISGTNAADFAINGINFPLLLEADSAVTFNITFTPNLLVSLTNEATVTITGSDLVNPVYTFKITAGVTSSSLNFDGNDDYVRAANPFTGSGNMTIEAWIKSPPGIMDTRNIVTFGNDNSNNGFIFYMTSGVLRCKVYGIPPISESTASINDGNWHHVAVVLTSGSFQLFVDGLPSGTPIAVTPDFLGPNIQIGTSWQANYNFWLGNIDEVRLWNTARTQAEIQNNMWCDLAVPQTGLAAVYHFSQGASNGYNSHVATLTDASGNNRTGTLYNFALSGPASNWQLSEAKGEIDIAGNGITIPDGSTSPSVSDSTDFCVTLLNQPVSRSFEIRNSGSGNLILGNGSISVTGASGFTISGITLPAVVAPGNSLSFTLTYLPVSNGTSIATVNVTANDCDESLYTFAVTGTGVTGFTGLSTDTYPCDGQVQVNWVWSGMAPVNFELERCNENTFANPVAVSQSIGGSINSYTDIPPVGIWYYRLRSVDACGKSGDWYTNSSNQFAVFDSTRIILNPQTICSGDVYSFNNNSYSVAGTYNDTLLTFFGCDSIIRTILNVNPTYNINNPQEICSGDSYSINGNTYVLPGNYYDTLYTVSGCDSVIVTHLTVHSLPSAYAGSDVTVCPGDSVFLSATGGVSYEWSNGILSQSNPLLPAVPGLYSVTVTDANGCTGSDDVLVSFQGPFQNEEICLVSVDTIMWKNKVMWEGTVGVGSDKFRIYKEIITNVYDMIGEVPYGSQTYFIDMSSNPESHSDRYKISVVDYCGNESDSSMYHNTMNLVISVFGSTMGLVWTPYQTEDGSYIPSQYHIYKGPSPAQMTLLTTVSGSQNTYNDLNVFDFQYYMIGAERNCNTYPTYSNKRDNGLVGSAAMSLSGTILISPNPMSSSATLTIPNFSNRLSGISDQITVTDITGTVVRVLSPSSILRPFDGLRAQDDSGWVKIERGDLKPGIYFVELRTDKVYRGKLVVE